MKTFQKKTLIYSTILILLLVLTFTKKILSKGVTFASNKTDAEKVIIKQGDSLALTLNNTRLSLKDSDCIIKKLKKLTNINRCMPGDFYEIAYNPKNGEWTDFCYYPSGISYYSITKFPNNNSIKVEKKKLSTVTESYKTRGVIHSSLWEAMTSQKIPSEIILSFTDIFKWKIDFLTDTKQGDSFKVIYEIEKINKKNTKLSSRIIAAQYKTSSKTYNAFYFKTKNSKGDYFNENGKSLKSAFLKSPLQFRMISSYFTTRRFHPILKYTRPHLGIDYAASKGTPVSAVGDGVVIKAQYNNKGFGNLVIVKHANGYKTYYGHLSKYGKGIKKGTKVSQGQVIGYVGDTGLATGPHLDFRIKQGGKFFNFLKMKHPSKIILTNEDKKEFRKRVQVFLNKFENQ